MWSVYNDTYIYFSNFLNIHVKAYVVGTHLNCLELSRLKYTGALVAQFDVPSDWRPGGRGFNPR